MTITETGDLPGGVTLTDDGDGSATLAGTPEEGSGNVYNLTLTASNGVDPDATQDFELIILEPPTITSGDTATFTAGQEGTFTVSATGYGTGADPNAISLSETGLLPNGVSFIDHGDGTATLSGTPADESGDEYDVTLTASNGVDPDATQDFQLVVLEPPIITSEDTDTFTVGQSGSFDVGATGYGTGADPNAISLSESGALPDGVTFTDEGDGVATLSGTPAARMAGTYDLTITASNGVRPDATQAFTLQVVDLPGAPEVVEATAGVDSAAVSWGPPASDGDSPTLSYTVTASPGGQSATAGGSATSATVSGLSAGTAYTFDVSATNAVGPGKAAASNTVVVTSTPIVDPTSATSSTPTGSSTTAAITSPSETTLTATADGEGTLDVGTYAADPVPALGNGTSYFDVAEAPTSAFSTITFQICGVGNESSVDWWNPASQSWQPVSNQTAPSGTPLCVTVTVNTSSSPLLSELTGTIFAVLGPSSVSTTTGLTLSKSSITYGSEATETFTVKVTGATGDGYPEGTVSVHDVSTELCSAGLNRQTGDNASASCSLSSSQLVAGTYDDVFAIYSPASPSSSKSAYSYGTSSSTPAQTFVVNPVTAKPAFTSASTVTASVGSAFTSTVSTTGTPAATLTETGTLPSGVIFTAFSNGTATVSGTPAAGTGGSYRLTLKATNWVGSATQKLVLIVDQAPAITSAASHTVAVGKSGRFTITTTGYPAASLTETGTLPSGVIFTANTNGTATFSGTPAVGAAGIYDLTIAASNGVGVPATQAFVLTVKA